MIPDTTRATRELTDGNEMPMLGLGVWPLTSDRMPPRSRIVEREPESE